MSDDRAALERTGEYAFSAAGPTASGRLPHVGAVGGGPPARGRPPAGAPHPPAPSPSTPEDRAREVEREDLEEDAPSTAEPEEAPAPSSPVFVGPPVPPETPADTPSPSPEPPSPEPPPVEESPVPSPEPFPTAPPTPDPAPLGVPALDPSPETAPSPEASPSPPPSPSPEPRHRHRPPSPSPEPIASPEPTPQPAPEPALAPPPSPAPSPEPSADRSGSDNATVLDKIGSFQDIEDIDLGDLLSVRSGEGGSRTADDEPGTVYVVTEEDIRRSGARGLHEVLETVPGLEVVTDDLGHGRVIVRGVPGALTSGGSENVLVLLNGLKLNENITGGAFAVNLDLPVDNIKRIEVVRGPGSVLYGVGAFLGVVNIVTESVDTFRRDELTPGRRIVPELPLQLPLRDDVPRGQPGRLPPVRVHGGRAPRHSRRPAERHRRRPRPPRHRARLARAGGDGRRSQGGGREPRPRVPRFRHEHPREEGRRGRVRGAARRAGTPEPPDQHPARHGRALGAHPARG